MLPLAAGRVLAVKRRLGLLRYELHRPSCPLQLKSEIALPPRLSPQSWQKEAMQQQVPLQCGLLGTNKE